MLSLDAKVQIVRMARGSTASPKSLANSSIIQSVHHMAIKEEEFSQDEDNEMEKYISQSVNMATIQTIPVTSCQPC